MTKSTNNWLKHIFTWEVLGVVLSAISLYIAYLTFIREDGGSLEVQYRTDMFSTPDDPVVFTDSRQSDMLSGMLPVLSNPSKYSLNNFLLQYTVEGAEVTTGAAFTAVTRQSAHELTYNDHTLYAYTKVAEPCQSITLPADEGSLTLSIRATFDGASKPFEVEKTCHYKVVTNRNMTAGQWQVLCAKKCAEAGIKDAWIYSGGSLARIDNIALTPASTAPSPTSRPASVDPKPQGQAEPVVTVIETENETMTVGSDESIGVVEAILLVLMYAFLFIGAIVFFFCVFEPMRELKKTNRLTRQALYDEFIHEIYDTYSPTPKQQKWGKIWWAYACLGGGATGVFICAVIWLICKLVPIILSLA